jgi:Ca2+/Na+ antiporter
MEATFILMAILIGVFALLTAINYIKRNSEKQITPAALAAIALIGIGVLLGDIKMIGYSMLGAGMILFVFEMIKEYKKKHPQH